MTPEAWQLANLTALLAAGFQLNEDRMKQLDWVGEPPPKKFKDIRNTQDAVAEEKARLCKAIGDVCNYRLPESVKAGSVNAVREWKKAREESMKVAGNKRASVNELSAALSNMGRFK